MEQPNLPLETQVLLQAINELKAGLGTTLQLLVALHQKLDFIMSQFVPSVEEESEE